MMLALYQSLFDKSHVGGWAVKFERFIAGLILLSTLSVVLEHVPDIYEPYRQAFHGPTPSHPEQDRVS